MTKDNPPIDELLSAYDVVDNWRSSHGYPINTFQATLRKKLKTMDSDALVAQRLKRMPSIIGKLKRFKSMKLARMQDLGGIRAVMSDMDKVRELEENYKKSNFRHDLVSTKDYIAKPKDSGYRSIHLVYKYQNPKVTAYDGLYVELQIRSKIQHSWATAVETIGTFIDHGLKSSEGPKEWLDFFSLAGSAFAHLEGTEPVLKYSHKDKKTTFAETLKEAERLCIYDKLIAFSIAAEKIHTDKKKGIYHLIILNLEEKTVSIQGYSQKNLELANREYAKLEKRIAIGEDLQVVLVSAGSIENLHRAYPNYFLDTNEFIKQLRLIEKDM